MIEVVRNPEWKSVVGKAIGLQVVFAVLMFMFMSQQVGRINEAIVNQNAALIGHVIGKEPQLENDIIRFITQGALENEVVAGKRILAQYGYNVAMSVEDQPALSGLSLPMMTTALVLLFVIPLMLLLLWEYRQLFGKIRTIAAAAEKVVERQYDNPLPENDEGDFGYLGRSFNAMAERLHNSLEQLKQEKSFLRNLLSDISHQLKTPIASLIIYNENLLHDPHMKKDMQLKFLERSRQQLERMEWLIISLLKLARVEAGAILYHKEETRLRELIEVAVQTLRSVYEQKKQTIRILGGEQILIQADAEWLTEAFINVIKNALEHTPEYGEIRIVIEENARFATVSVHDNGEGISPEDLPHIFKRFYSGRRTTKPQSVGIGLSLTKSIIEGQDGIITVASQPGDGTEFNMAFIKGNG